MNDRGGDRTRGLRIKSPLLYQLSYPVEAVGKVAYPLNERLRVHPIASGLSCREHREEAARLNHEYVGTEHLMMG